MSKSQTLKRTSYLRLIIGNILVICLILVVLEGVASYLLVFYEILMTHQVAERLHTRYDPQLGWANKPSVNMPDMYGPGISLKTNSQGFRADHDFDFSVSPVGSERVFDHVVGLSTWRSLWGRHSAAIQIRLNRPPGEDFDASESLLQAPASSRPE